MTRVVDGDTLIVGKRKVRVLGIDSCEATTRGGRAATAEAKRLVLGKTVQLIAEGGADKDRFGRALRYVEMPDGHDFGLAMVAETHTGLYNDGDSDAAADYVTRLRSADPTGRS